VTTAEFETGRRFGAYVLGKLLGRGGMGVVYEAQHVHLGRTVALKLLAPDLSRNADFRARFLREAQLAATLEHPSVVTVYDAGEVEGVLYLAMRFVRGTDLAALLAKRGPLMADEAFSILGQVATALDAAHAAGLVHRDVKPANVMIEGERCYLTDFGLTKRTTPDSQPLTVTGQFFGTVDYVAPEQIEGRDQDGRVDVYALGCVLFECLTGSRPYPRDSQLAVIYAQLRDPAPRVTELRPDLPPAIDAVIAKAMAKAPDARYQTCVAMIEGGRDAVVEGAAQPLVQDLPTAPLAAPAPTTGPSPPPTGPTAALAPAAARRRRPLAVLAALFLLAVVAVVAVLALSGGSNPKKTASSGPVTTPATRDPHIVGAPLHVGARPIGIVDRNGFLWVADNATGKVIRVRPDGGGRKEIAVGRGPFDMASNTTSVWVANSLSNSVQRIETSAARAGPPIAVGANPLFLTAQEDFVYVSNSGSDTVSVVDARNGQVVGSPIPVGKDPRGIGANGRVAWVTNHGSNTVSRIENGRVTVTVPVGRNPVGIAPRKDGIWVANEGDDTVSRIDPATGRVTSTKVGSRPYAVGYNAPYIWVANRGSNDMTRIDPASGKTVGKPIPIPGEPLNMTQRDSFLWVTAAAARTVTQLKP
jgi:YVTN family beta-propeller protein